MKKRLVDLFKSLIDPSQNSAEGGIKNDVSLDNQLRLATCALLLEMSKSDNDIAQQETDTIISALANAYNIEDSEIDLLRQAAEEELDKSTSLRNFTSLINEHYSSHQKEEIIKLLWQVAHADGVIDGNESHLIRTVADLLYVPREHAMSLR